MKIWTNTFHISGKTIRPTQKGLPAPTLFHRPPSWLFRVCALQLTTLSIHSNKSLPQTPSPFSPLCCLTSWHPSRGYNLLDVLQSFRFSHSELILLLLCLQTTPPPLSLWILLEDVSVFQLQCEFFEGGATLYSSFHSTLPSHGLCHAQWKLYIAPFGSPSKPTYFPFLVGKENCLVDVN